MSSGLLNRKRQLRAHLRRRGPDPLLKMALVLPVIAVGLAGYGTISLLQMCALEDCTDGRKNDITLIIVGIALFGKWAALAREIIFAIATKKREAHSVANALFGASQFTLLSGLLVRLSEVAFCDLRVVEVLNASLVACFTLTAMAAPLALLWRAWHGV